MIVVMLIINLVVTQYYCLSITYVYQVLLLLSLLVLLCLRGEY